MGLQPRNGCPYSWLETICDSGAIGAVLVNLLGVTLAVVGAILPASGLFLLGATLAIAALRIFEPSVKEAKTRVSIRAFPSLFEWLMEWLLVAGRWSGGSPVGQLRGIWGASRHALTVGFISVMILSVGSASCQPFRHETLVEHEIMFGGLHSSLWVHVAGVCEVIAYQGLRELAWSVLPVSRVRARGANNLCHKYSRNFHVSAEPRCKQRLVVGCR